MSRARTKLLVLFVASVLIILGLRALRGRSGSTAVEEAQDELIDGRVWVEGRPDRMTDYVHAALFAPRANLGLFERASAYDLRLEFFDLSRQKGALRIHFPQTKKDANVTFVVKECSDKAPFDLCLDLSDNPWGGPKRYYGFQKPEDEKAQLGGLSARMREAAAAPRPAAETP
jgi:hypothetical protein